MLLCRHYKNKPHVILAFGQFSLAVSILLHRFIASHVTGSLGMAASEGAAGLFMGLSLVFNLAGLIYLRRQIK